MARLRMISLLICLTTKTVLGGDPRKRTGIETEVLSLPLFYQAFVPIIQEFILPHWTSPDLQTQELKGWDNSTCGYYNDEYRAVAVEDRYNCPFHPFIIGFLKNITIWKGYQDFDSSQLPSSLSCEEIAPHFTSFNQPSEEYSKYVETLRKCRLGPLMQIHLGLTNFSSVNTTLYKTLLQSSGTRTVDSYRESRVYPTFQTAELLDFYMLSNRWRDTIFSCESNKIPHSFFPYDELTRRLSQIRLGLHHDLKGTYELAIPETYKSVYYKLPLTDCTFTAGNKYLVRVLIPIKRTQSNFQLVKLHSIPFVKEHGSEIVTVCSVPNIEGKYIVDNSTGLVLKTDCSTNELCLVPDKSSMTLDPCLSALLISTGNRNIEKLCKVNCMEVAAEAFPIFKRISSDTCIVIGKSSKDLEIFATCEGKPYKVIKVNETGALEIKLPCFCTLVYQTQEFQSESPCGGFFKISGYSPQIFGERAQDSELVWVGGSQNTQLGIIWAILVIFVILFVFLIMTTFLLSKEIRDCRNAIGKDYAMEIMKNLPYPFN